MKKNILTVIVSLLICCIIGSFSMQVNAATTKNQKAMEAYDVLLQKAKYVQGGFFVVDINKDGVKELFVTQKLDSSDFTMKYHHYSQVEIYTYLKGKLKRLKNIKFGSGVYNFDYGKKSKFLAIDINAADREVVEIYKIKNGKLIKAGIFDSGHNTSPKYINCITKKTTYFKSYKSYQKSRNKYGTKEVALIKNYAVNRSKYLK